MAHAVGFPEVVPSSELRTIPKWVLKSGIPAFIPLSFMCRQMSWISVILKCGLKPEDKCKVELIVPEKMFKYLWWDIVHYYVSVLRATCVCWSWLQSHLVRMELCPPTGKFHGVAPGWGTRSFWRFTAASFFQTRKCSRSVVMNLRALSYVEYQRCSL